MPVVAVGIAVVADVAAGSAIAGAVTAGVVSLATIATVVGAVGATLSAIGTVTGDKTLTEVGTGLGIVGGLTSFANSAGLFGNTSDLFGDSTAAANTAATGTAATAAGTATSGTGSGDIVNSLGNVNSPDPNANLLQAVGTTEGQAGDVLPNPVTGALAANTAAAPAASAPATIGNAATGAGTPALAAGNESLGAVPPNPVQLASGAQGAGATTPGLPGVPAPPESPVIAAALDKLTPVTAPAAPSVLGNLVNFAKTSGGGLTALGALQVGGSFLSGATNALTPAQVNEANAQAAANQAQTLFTSMQISNMKQPLPTATISPTAALTPGGLINSSPAVAA